MKEIKELKFEELTVPQKLGLAHIIAINGWTRRQHPELDKIVLDLIKNHALGGVWVQHDTPDAQEIIDMVKEAADYRFLFLPMQKAVLKLKILNILYG